MLQELGLWSLLILSLLFPEAQSARVRFFDLHHHHHNVHGSRVYSESHLQMVIKPKKKYAQHEGPNIELVTVPSLHHQQDTPVALSNPSEKSQSSAAEGFNFHESMLDAPLATSNRDVNSHTHVESRSSTGRNSVGFASMLDTPVSGPNPGGNSQSLASMLDTPVSGPNPSAYSQGLSSTLGAVSGPNPCGDSQSLTSMWDTRISGPNSGGNSQSLVPSGRLAKVLDTLISDPNPGGNTQSIETMVNIPVSGPNPEGNSQSLLVSGSYPSGNSHRLTVSVPNLGSNMEGLASMLDTPVSGPNPGGNSETLVSMLDTLVSGPNPGSNAQSLAVSGPNPGSNSHTLPSMLDTAISGPNPGGNAVFGPNPKGNSHSILNILDTPVSGPNPGGNSEVLSVVSGPNPGGNSQILAASSGPNPMGNSQVLATRFGTKPSDNGQSEGDIQHHTTHQAYTAERDLNALLDSPVSGPNPGGNTEILGVQTLAGSSGPNPGGNAHILDVSSGPNPGGNSNILMMSKSTGVVDVGEHEEHITPQTLAASSGPNPSGSTEILGIETLAASSGPNPEGNAQILAMSSGPNPGGNGNIVMMSESKGAVVDVQEHEEHITPQTLDTGAVLMPGGNMPNLVIDTLAASSGPNPGGNAQILAASSGPNPGGNSNILMVSKESEMDILKHEKSVKTHETHMPDEQTPLGKDPHVKGILARLAVSGPNPGGNSDILIVTATSVKFSPHKESKPVEVEKANSIGVTGQAIVSGHNHAEHLGSNLASTSKPAGNVKELSMGLTSSNHDPELGISLEPFSEFGSNYATLEPNPGGNVHELGLSGNARRLKEGSYANPHASHESSMHHVHADGNDVSQTYTTVEESSMNGASVFNKLPRAPEPPSGPSPSHNSEITQQSLFANDLRRETLGVIDCGKETGDIDLPKEESVPSRMFHHNEEFYSIMRMGVASTKKSTA